MPPYHHSVKESVIWSVKRGQMYVFTFIFMLGVKEDQIEDDTTTILTLPNLALHHKFYMASDGRCMEII